MVSKDEFNNKITKDGMTRVFKEHIRQIILQELGVEVSIEKAWKLYKSMEFGRLEFVLNTTGQRLPLTGIGTYVVRQTKPRGKKAGVDRYGNPISGAEVVSFVPRFRLRPSSVVQDICDAYFGMSKKEIDTKHYGLFRD